MSLQSRNADVLTTALIEGVMTHDQYVALSIRGGATDEQARKNLAAILKDHVDGQEKEILTAFKNDVLTQFFALGRSFTLPSGIQAVKISIQMDNRGSLLDKFQIMKTEGQRFISYSEARYDNSSGGNGKVPIPTQLKEAGLDSWVKICGALNIETDSTKNARLTLKRHGGDKGLALYNLTNDAVEDLPADTSKEDRQLAIDEAYASSMLTFP